MRFELIVHLRCHTSVMGWSQNGQLWSAKLRPDSSSSFAHHAHHPGRALHEVGNAVLSIVGVRSVDLLFWEERMQAVSSSLTACTDDGSYGREALATTHEDGIPAVLGTGVATKRIQFAQTICMAGEAGTVTLLDESGASRSCGLEFRAMSSRRSGSDWRPNFCRFQRGSKKPRSCASVHVPLCPSVLLHHTPCALSSSIAALWVSIRSVMSSSA
jgi:hypothetical protein